MHVGSLYIYSWVSLTKIIIHTEPQQLSKGIFCVREFLARPASPRQAKCQVNVAKYFDWLVTSAPDAKEQESARCGTDVRPKIATVLQDLPAAF